MKYFSILVSTVFLLMVLGCTKQDTKYSGYLMPEEDVVVNAYKVGNIALTEPYNIVLINQDNQSDFIAITTNVVSCSEKAFVFKYTSEKFGDFAISGKANKGDFVKDLSNLSALVVLSVNGKEYSGLYRWWGGD